MIEHHMMWARVNQQIVLCYTHIDELQLNWKTLLDKRLSFQKFEEEMCFERLSRTDILLWQTDDGAHPGTRISQALKQWKGQVWP